MGVPRSTVKLGPAVVFKSARILGLESDCNGFTVVGELLGFQAQRWDGKLGARRAGGG